jgi:NAD(P)-dependent dehydrogenase (short-subunit alcohol dehydrogenase family)
MDADELARRLDVSLHSPGVCLACLDEYAQSGDNWFVVTLWQEGLGDTVAAALRAVAGADELKRDFASRGCRSDLFRAVMRKLAREIEEDARRALAAIWNGPP